MGPRAFGGHIRSPGETGRAIIPTVHHGGNARKSSAENRSRTTFRRLGVGMSIAIRDVREHELDSVLALNNAAGPAILPLDAAKLRQLYASAEYFRVAERDGAIAGFLIGFGAHARHDSSNFAWFAQRYPDFFYIDRVAVASRRRG